ncbi:hypothetical protein GV828_07945 [Flavobacterium sp. NST-5]|uniref:Peptidase M56 domain-containing protein n=1 Tax=Flavobacterium ichthyis TaxID=2698827 RepID=A0ABW9ZCT0_9FLAO|nr:M56 family metallopeptidase [Flavobacterium ichthyis]NBL65127.1 hypothetical protein [Flavobacterium ichthyis]
MENFVIYLGKVSLILAIFCLTYQILLRKETFFNANRWFLILGIFTSLLLPFLIFTKIIWVKSVTQEVFPTAVTYSDIESLKNIETNFEINWFYVFGGIYFAGVFFFAARFAKDFWSLLKILKHQKPEHKNYLKYVDSEKVKAPFSFFGYIIYNSTQFKEEELQNILAHEKVHSLQFHSVDMLLSQIYCIIFWFNPFAWLYQKAIAQNLEFIADHQALKKISNKIQYQKTLLKVSTSNECIPISNHFYQSLIKKRIVMLNKNQSKKTSVWRYATILPMLAMFVLQFQVETIAQTKETQPKYQVTATYTDDDSKKVDGFMILPSITDETLNDYVEKFSDDHDISLKVEVLKRNASGEILELNIDFDNKKGNKINQKIKKSNKPISSILVTSNKLSNGNTTIIINDLGEKDAAIGREATAKEVDAIAIAEGNTAGATASATADEYSSSFMTTTPDESFNRMVEGAEVDYNKAFILINGKEATVMEFEKLRPSKLSTLSLMNANEVLVKKYGEKAKNGVIIIETTDFTTIPAATGTNGKEFKLPAESGFLIHKKSEKDDFDFYKETLAKSNIDFKYSAVDRNSKGEITGIKIKLTRKNGGKNEVVSWNTNADEPINDIFIGERNGKLVIQKQ